MFKPLSRRTMLQGMGVTMALPWLETMTGSLHAGEKLTAPPLRAAFLFKPNGVRPDYWTPKGDTYEPNTPYLKPFAHLKDDFILLENLYNKKTAGRNGHWPKPRHRAGTLSGFQTAAQFWPSGSTVHHLQREIRQSLCRP